MAITPALKPVCLQVKNAGSWKTVARFDAGDNLAGESVQHAVDILGTVDPSCTWRIATAEPNPLVLMRWCKATGWSEA